MIEGGVEEDIVDVELLNWGNLNLGNLKDE